MMRTSLAAPDLAAYVCRLLGAHLPDGHAPCADLLRHVRRSLERVEYCFRQIERKYYREGSTTIFDHLNADHMAAFLWFLGNTIWHDAADEGFPTRLSYLNKIMHGLDLFYSVPMPDIFLLVHPVGSVLGRATYGDYLVVYQNCTVGADGDDYPAFREGVILYSRSSVLGRCHVGPNVVFAANSFVVNLTVPADTVVVGQYPEHRLLPNGTSVRSRCFAARTPAARPFAEPA